MERNKENKDTKKEGIKVKKKVARLILEKRTFFKIKELLKKANKNPYGKKVKPKDLVQKSISLITDEHLFELKSATLSNQDHIDMKFKQYQKQNPKISKDEFLGKLLCGKLGAED